jgi:hypothetical protein
MFVRNGIQMIDSAKRTIVVVNTAQTHQGIELELRGISEEESYLFCMMRINPYPRLGDRIGFEINDRLAELSFQSVVDFLGSHGDIGVITTLESLPRQFPFASESQRKCLWECLDVPCGLNEPEESLPMPVLFPKSRVSWCAPNETGPSATPYAPDCTYTCPYFTLRSSSNSHFVLHAITISTYGL